MPKFKVAALSGVAMLMTQTSASAQDTATAGAEQGEPAAGTIIVTARKVEESIQDVPVAISAFSAADISKRSIRGLEDVALQTPGLVYEDFSNGGYGTPTIRGTSQLSITGLEQNVSVFIDGVYIPRQYAFDLGSANLDRIEVVKGPQSALYGANAFAGAINYVTTGRSMNRLTAHAEATVSEDSGFEVIGKINVPVIEDILSVRVAAGHSEFGGGFVNNHPDANAGVYPGTNGKTGGYNKDSFMVGASLKPFDALKIDFDYYDFDTFTEGGAYYRIESAIGGTNCGGNRALICGELSKDPIPLSSGVPGLVKDPRTFGIIADTRIYRAAAELELTDNLSLTYLFGNIAGNVFSGGSSEVDPLAGPLNFFAFGPVGNFEYETHEARLAYQADSGFYAMIGGFDLDGRDFDLFAFGNVPFRDLTPITTVPASAVQIPATTLVGNQSIFGRVAVPFIDKKLTISVEGRYTEETRSISATSFGYSDKYFTPRISLDYKVSRDNLIYGSVAKGVKSGGINVSSFAGLIPSERFYGPDTNWTYEIGTKNSFDNGRGTLNLALFYIDWANLQLTTTPTGAPFNTPSITTNLGGATSKGVELDGQYEVLDGLTFNAGLAYIDATYKDGTVSARIIRTRICDDIVCNSNGDVSGNEIQRTAKWQWNVGLAYNAPINEKINSFARLDIAGQSRMFTDETNTAIIEPRALVNLRTGIEFGNFSFNIWAKNVLNARYVSNAFFAATPFGTSYVPAFGSPRRVGATASFDF